MTGLRLGLRGVDETISAIVTGIVALLISGCAAKVLESQSSGVVSVGAAGVSGSESREGGPGGEPISGSGGGPVSGAGGTVTGTGGVASVGSGGPPPFGGGGTACAWSTPATIAPGKCGAWWGGTVAGAVGAAACPCPDSPQFLAYGMTQFSPGNTITGPYGSTMDGEIVSCLYDFVWDPNGPTNRSPFELPYFGGGTGKLAIPTTTVSAARSKCATAPGQEIASPTFAEAAKQLIGVWVTCSASPATGSVVKYGGMAFHPDGSFEALEADSSDHLVPVSECNASGLWGLDTTQNIQLNLYIDGGEVIYTWKAYSGPARLLSLDDSLGPVALVPVE